MALDSKLKSGQINYESLNNKGAFSCIVIRDGVFHNMTEDIRLDLIKQLQNAAPKQEVIDIDDMF